jgi:nucleoside-diphosphate-sugar epimerase
MRIFLTGASSYIGKYIISSLLINGHTVLSTSRRSPKIYSKSHKWFKHDLSKKTFKMGSFNPDMIIHLAGYAWMGHEPEKYVNSNILTTLNLVKSLKNKKFKKFFYLSTRDIYGEITDKELREDTRINNPDVYGHSKLIAEKILADSFPIITLRLPSIIGLGTHGWIYSVLNKLKKNQKILMVDTRFNNFMHASELSKIILKLYKSKLKSDIFLVSCSNKINSLQVVKILKSKLKSKSKIGIIKTNKNSYIISSKKLNRIYKTITVQKVLDIYSEEIKFKRKFIY